LRRRAAIVPAVAHESQPLTATAPAYASRPGAAHRHTDPPGQGHDPDFNINLPAMHDKPACLGTVRSSCRSGRLPASGYAYGAAHRPPGSARPLGDRHSDLVADHNAAVCASPQACADHVARRGLFDLSAPTADSQAKIDHLVYRRGFSGVTVLRLEQYRAVSGIIRSKPGSRGFHQVNR